ncbi:hypothetical protein FHS97_001739 [Sphingomonas endophytica]|uniref:Uncharacterized protein n=1 Tax=Sphingomonas endophytica TaxID=869719 RepID=A0ABR6N4V4_9SPHN|nr:hypothetical protein [Sphingomonas endophytica]
MASVTMLQLFSESLTALAGTNVSLRDAAIWIASPLAGSGSLPPRRTFPKYHPFRESFGRRDSQ